MLVAQVVRAERLGGESQRLRQVKGWAASDTAASEPFYFDARCMEQDCAKVSWQPVVSVKRVAAALWASWVGWQQAVRQLAWVSR